MTRELVSHQVGDNEFRECLRVRYSLGVIIPGSNDYRSSQQRRGLVVNDGLKRGDQSELLGTLVPSSKLQVDELISLRESSSTS